MNEKVVALSRFISKAIDKCVSIFDALKKSKTNFGWNHDYQNIFKELLMHIDTPLILSKPIDGLFFYVVVSSHALSMALVHEEARIQRLVYYISKWFTMA